MINKHNARLVAKRHIQLEGINYYEMFALVFKIVTLQTILSIATSRGWYMHQMDVHNFLHDDLDGDIYMTIPQGYGHIEVLWENLFI